jgi:putative acetyltransferase
VKNNAVNLEKIVCKDTIVIRKIEPSDNSKMAKTIRSVLIEMGVPKVGTAYEDKALDSMFETYIDKGEAYFVVSDGNTIYGGAGIAPLDNYSGNICELQKMYFSKAIRGLGFGSKMMRQCLDFAKEVGFEKCYLETMPYMTDAQKLYKKFGFKSIDKPLGDTGHYSCTVWMIKDL